MGIFILIMDINACYKIGYVAKTHGLKGEVTVVTLPECPDISSVKCLFILQNHGLVPFFIESVSIKGEKAYIKFEEVRSIEKASMLKGSSIFLAKEERPSPGRGDFYNDEVIGFEVIDQTGHLGTVVDVEEAGANRFLVVNYRERKILVPVSGPFIKSLNKSKKKVNVDLPEGFLDI